MRSQLSRDSLPSSLPTTAVAADLVWDDLIVLQSNIDDVSPQVLAYTMDKLLATGALDVWVVGCIMKKGRQGMQLNVLCRPEQRDELVAIVLQETTSLGVRVHTCERASLPRQFVQVRHAWAVHRLPLLRQEPPSRLHLYCSQVARIAQLIFLGGG